MLARRGALSNNFQHVTWLSSYGFHSGVSCFYLRHLVRLNFVLSIAYMLYAMVITFKTYLNRPGPLWKILNDNSYGVYIIHTVIMGGIAAILLNTAIPSLAKFLLVIIFTFVVSNVIVYGSRKLLKVLFSVIETSRYEEEYV